MTCPAIAVEIAPERDADKNITTEPDNPDYQSPRCAALAAAILEWRSDPSRTEAPPAVIPRYQKILFAVLLLASLGMGFKLWQLRDSAHKRLLAGETTAPTQAPEVAPAEQATLVAANDMDNSLVSQMHSLPLPADPGARARAVLGKLLDLYAAPNSTHPVPGGAASVAQVFLLPTPGSKASDSRVNSPSSTSPAPSPPAIPPASKPNP